MIRLYALVAVGGAIGSVARFFVATSMTRLTGPAFPWGTIAINIFGSLLIGWLAGFTRGPGNASLQAFTMVGMCGGFTTFSAFSLQTVELLRAGSLVAAAANAVGSVVLCVAACFAGLWISR